MATPEENAKNWIQKNPYEIYNHLVLKAIDETICVFEVEVTDEMKNRHGFAHGGFLYTLADSTSGGLVHMDGRQYVTQNASFQFLKSPKDGVIHSVGRIVHRGRSTCLVEVEVRNADDVLLAKGSFTYFCISPR